jgi:hypothetical protein
MSIKGGKKSQGFYKGIFKISYPHKYCGMKPPIYRSSWEARFCGFLDNNKNVIKWDSEPSKMTIQYILPDGTEHKYVPDYYVEMKTRDGRIKKFLIEVKPSDQSPYHSPPPKEPKRKSAKAMRNFRGKLKMYLKNKYKWIEAEKWCKKRGLKFIVYTEIEACGGFKG